VDSYSSTINTYLDTHEYDSIVLAGYSEGACLLPLIYKNVKSQSNIKGIVSMSYGGLSVYEQIKILGESPLEMTDYYREACLSVDEYKKDVELYPDSIGEIMGYTYGWWNSFKDYRPIDDYREINIPVLFVHGKLDIMVPVESTEYIQENLPDKPFEYLYIDDLDHYFSREDGKAIIKDKIVEWINKR
jgi:pimeloyl-ACP methyl ester carboxylesterase